MEKYGEYFEQPARAKRSTVPVCTGTSGAIIKRVGVVSLKRVLDNPTNLRCDDANNYAFIHCEAKGVWLMRIGVRIKTAEFILGAYNPPKELSLVGPSGRDELIRRFLRILKSAKSYAHRQGPDKLVERAERFPKRKRKAK